MLTSPPDLGSSGARSKSSALGPLFALDLLLLEGEGEGGIFQLLQFPLAGKKRSRDASRRRTLKSTLHPSIFWEMVKFVALGVLYFSLVLPE